MVNKDILNKIEFFSRCIKHLVVELKEVRCKQQNQHKMIDIWTNISHIHLGFRLDSEEIMNKPNFIDLPITACFCEVSDIIENLKIRADAAMDDAMKGNYSDYFPEWLNDAINRLPSISERLEDYIKTEWANTEKKYEAMSLADKLNELSAKISSNKAMAMAVIKQNENAPKGSITYTEKQIVRDTWNRLYDEARTIFIEAGKQNITLPIVSAGGDSLKDFQRLQGWIDESLCKIASGKANLPNEKSTETKQGFKTTIIAIIISLVISCIFLLSVWFIPFAPFNWLKNHPNSYGLQGSIFCLIISFVVGLFKPQWRGRCWGGGALLAFIVVILPLLGGPTERIK
jgi:hypothetical protein